MSAASSRSLRCGWAEASELMRTYHDEEWGVPSRDDGHLFELLILEGAQAGLSWSTVLAKRENYRRAFDHFDFDLIARYDDRKLASLLADPGIIRNRLKLQSTIGNARAFLEARQEFGAFARYLWAWVDEDPLINHPRVLADIPTRSELSDRLSKDLKRRGFRFVGTTITYSFLQAVGVINDHLVTCPAK